MKVRIKATGEIIDVNFINEFYAKEISLSSSARAFPVNELEHISDTVDWEEVRIKASIAAMQGTITILSSSDRYAFREVVVEGFRGEQKTYPNEIAQFSVAVADALIKELKKGNKTRNNDAQKASVPSILDLRVIDSDFSVRTLNAMNCVLDKSVHDATIRDIVKLKAEDLLKVRNFGKASLTEIQDFLANYGLKLGMNDTTISNTNTC